MFKIEFLHRDDVNNKAKLKRFIEEQRTKELLQSPDKVENLRTRPEEMMNRAFDSGESLVLTRDGEICGASFIYEFMDEEGSAYSFVEMGTMMVDNSANRYGMQRVFAYLHIFNTLYFNPGFKPKFFAVVSEGTASEYILKSHVKMPEWNDISTELVQYRADAGVPFLDCKMNLECNNQSIIYSLNQLKKLRIEDQLINTPKGNSTIFVDIHPISVQSLDVLIDAIIDGS